MSDLISQIKWGCSRAEYLSLRCKPMRVFQSQRARARARGIEWKLTLWEWWTIWQESGHWKDRGRGQGYVMCRVGDDGPYAVGNVFIAPSIINSSQKSIKVSGLPVGVYRKRNRFCSSRMIDGKVHRLGSYATAAAAHEAYLSLGPIGRGP